MGTIVSLNEEKLKDFHVWVQIIGGNVDIKKALLSVETAEGKVMIFYLNTDVVDITNLAAYANDFAVLTRSNGYVGDE